MTSEARRRPHPSILAALTVLAAPGLAGCRTSVVVGGLADGGGADAGHGLCEDCLQNDCAPGLACVQVGGSASCMKACTATSDCPSTEACTAGVTTGGDQVKVCVDADGDCEVSGFDCDDCGAGTVCNRALNRCDPVTDAGTPPACGALVPPSTAGTCCHSCRAGASDCQANRCYNGWWCDTSSCRCREPAGDCGGADGGTPADTDGGPPIDAPVTGGVTSAGGTVSRLYFAVIGDTRPSKADDTAGYPTSIIEKIYEDVAALSPAPSFAVTTGDYIFATPGRGTADAQMRLYVAARGRYPNEVFHVLGNHECNGYTTSNCGDGSHQGSTENYRAFLTQLLAPQGFAKPWFDVAVTAADGRWTAKLVFVAANAWNAEQATWLEEVLTRPSTFTFVFRHEPSTDTRAPGTQASEQILRRHPLTLLVVGHTHLFQFTAGRQEVVVGNGGAPLTSGDYGFATVSQVADDVVVLSQYDYSQPLPVRSWAVNAAGQPVP
jgi:hypothetical protein